METQKAKVVNVVEASTRYGRKLVLNATLLNDGSKVAVWSDDLGNKLIRSKHKGNIVELIESAKGKYSLLDRGPSHNTNGNGSTQSFNGNSKISEAKQIIDDYEANNLGLPELLTDTEREDLRKLTVERAQLLVSCIEIMKDEMDNKGFEFYENSVRSLGVSLYIGISRYLP